MRSGTLSTADLPVSMRAPVEDIRTPVVTTTSVLTCQHGPACPACVLSTARVLIEADAGLSSALYTA
jgi:hypothetical protein